MIHHSEKKIYSDSPGSDCWKRGKETSFSIYTTLVAMCCTIVYEWTGGRYLVVIHHCVEWFNPHRINVPIQHNPLRSCVGDVCLLSHHWWKQTLHRDWRTQNEITWYKYSLHRLWVSTGSLVLNFLLLIQNQFWSFTIFPLSSCWMDEAKQFISVHCFWIEVIPHRLPLQVYVGFMENSQDLWKR